MQTINHHGAQQGKEKSLIVVYVLALSVGIVGTHRYYVDRSESGFWMTLIFTFGIISPNIVGNIFICVIALWTLVDLFLVPGFVREYNRSLRSRIAQ